MKVLVCSDIHMGRIPSVGSVLALDSHSSFNAVIDKAIALHVDVVAFVGDVVEHDDAWLSVYGPLMQGLEKLKDSHIQAIGVGGNHDYSVFPRLVADTDSIRILGSGGKWESFIYQDVQFIGWSFPEAHVKASPFRTLPNDLRDSSKLSLGLLHGEVTTSPTSEYAPISEIDLQNSNVDYWMLGHIHKTSKVGKKARYCGSPYALDVNESGEHGVYLLDSEKGYWEETFISLCPYRFERCEVMVNDCASSEEIQTQMLRTAREQAASLEGDQDLFFRIVFTGDLNPSISITSIMQSINSGENSGFKEQNHMVYILDRAEDVTLPALDIDDLAKGSGPLALLAQMINDEKQIPKLIALFQQYNTESYSSSAFSKLDPNQLNQAEATIEVKKAALSLLRTMYSQQSEVNK